MFPARWLGRLGRSRVCQAGFARSRQEIEMRSKGSEWLPALRPCARARPNATPAHLETHRLPLAMSFRTDGLAPLRAMLGWQAGRDDVHPGPVVSLKIRHKG